MRPQPLWDTRLFDGTQRLGSLRRRTSVQSPSLSTLR
jgi:hypothetical protein